MIQGRGGKSSERRVQISLLPQNHTEGSVNL
jgi:hypothetical protein